MPIGITKITRSGGKKISSSTLKPIFSMYKPICIRSAHLFIFQSPYDTANCATPINKSINDNISNPRISPHLLERKELGTIVKVLKL